MADREDNNQVTINTVPSDITAISKVDQPFAKIFGQIVYQATHARLCAERFHTLAYGFTRPARGIRVLGTQEIPEALQISQRGR